jgi:hypothetical protein
MNRNKEGMEMRMGFFVVANVMLRKTTNSSIGLNMGSGG